MYVRIVLLHKFPNFSRLFAIYFELNTGTPSAIHGRTPHFKRFRCAGVWMSELLQGRTVRPCTVDSPLCSSFCGSRHRSAPKNPSTSSIRTLHVSLTYPFPLSLSLISSPSLSLISSHISPSRFLILSPSYCSWAGGACGQWWLGSMAPVAGVVWQCWYI